MVIVVEFVYSRHQIMNEGELKINQDNNSKIWIEMIVASFLDAILIDDIHANKQHERETRLYISNHKESVSFEKKEETDSTFAAAFISCSPLKEYVASFLF